MKEENLKTLNEKYNTILNDFKTFAENYEGKNLSEDFQSEFKERYDDISSSFSDIIRRQVKVSKEEGVHVIENLPILKNIHRLNNILMMTYEAYLKVAFHEKAVN